MSKHDEILLRRSKVVELREEGNTVREIADALGVSPGTAASDLIAVRREAVERIKSVSNGWVERELRDLEEIQAIALELSETEPEAATRLQALDRRLKVSTERRKLMGLDAPERHEDVTPGALTLDQIAATAREIFKNDVGSRDRGGPPGDVPGAAAGTDDTKRS